MDLDFLEKRKRDFNNILFVFLLYIYSTIVGIAIILTCNDLLIVKENVKFIFIFIFFNLYLLFLFISFINKDKKYLKYHENFSDLDVLPIIFNLIMYIVVFMIIVNIKNDFEFFVFKILSFFLLFVEIYFYFAIKSNLESINNYESNLKKYIIKKLSKIEHFNIKQYLIDNKKGFEEIENKYNEKLYSCLEKKYSNKWYLEDINNIKINSKKLKSLEDKYIQLYKKESLKLIDRNINNFKGK